MPDSLIGTHGWASRKSVGNRLAWAGRRTHPRVAPRRSAVMDLTRDQRAEAGGLCPREAALRLTDAALSAGAREVVGLAGALGSFAEAAEKVLPRLAGLRVAESTVERAAERAGADVGRRLAAGETFG